MASGDTLFVFEPQNNIPPSSNYATLGTITAATGERLILEFSTSADESAIFAGTWPSHYDYDGNPGINVKLHYGTDGTDTGEIEFLVSAEVLQDNDDTDAGGQDFGTATSITDTPATATANYVNITAAGAISDANCGAPTSGDGFRLKIERDADHATSANTDTLQLHRVVVTEQ